MAQYTVKYRTFDQLLEDVSVDFSGYALEGMIEPQQLIKVATRVNYDLGLRIHQQKEIVLDVEHGKAKLPSDFYTLNFALLASKVTYTEVMPSGTHIEDVIVPLSTNCVPAAPTTTTSTVSTTTETTGEGTPAVTQTIEHPATGGTFESYTGELTTQALGSQTVYNPNNDEFLLIQAYSNPSIIWTVAPDGTESSSTTLNRNYLDFVYVPGLNVFVAGSPDNHIGLFSAEDYSLITEITMTYANGTGSWFLTYDANNSCLWACQQYDTTRHHKIAITATSLTAGAYVNIDTFNSNDQNTALIYYNGNLYGFSYSNVGSVAQGFNTDVTVMPIVNGAIDINNIGKYTNGDSSWDSQYYKNQPRGEKTVALDTNTGLFWIRFDGHDAQATPYIFTWDPADQSWTHILTSVPNPYTTGSIVYDSFGGNMIYSAGIDNSKVIRISDNTIIDSVLISSSDIAVSSADGSVLLARNNGSTAYLMQASYSGGTEAWTETVVVTPAIPGETISETVTTTTTSTSGVDALYQCQPENTCINKCGEYYQLVQKFKTHTVCYETLEAIRIKPSSSVSGDCPNTRWSARNQADIRGGFIYTSFQTGKLYINYQGAMEDENGQLLVMDHPMINEFYEYAIKQRVLENMYINGEDVVQKLNLVEQRLRGARNNALSIVNMPDFAEMKKLWETNRRSQYHKYFDMFKSYPVIQ
jgi:hypothetical protein